LKTQYQGYYSYLRGTIWQCASLYQNPTSIENKYTCCNENMPIYSFLFSLIKGGVQRGWWEDCQGEELIWGGGI
jgi:hypothetical protein